MIVSIYRRYLQLKKKLERAREQVYCPHEYEIILEHSTNGYPQYDVFCPICEDKKENLKKWEWRHIQKERELLEKETQKRERENAV